VSQTKPTAAEPAEIAGRYQIEKKLGAGAFGTVYKAKDKILGRMVAIKTIRLEGLAAAGASLEELLDRFKREAQVSAQLKHQHIVTIYDIGDSEGMSYLAMEFIDGQGLDRIIAAEGKLGVERAAAIAAQVADALDFAHRHSVVHRDIKPANIMIEAGDRVKVTDFGIAKVTTSTEHLTMTGSLLGTPSYMSPEQARGGDLDGRSDLFSVGCVLYEMLVGKKAFRGDSITALIFKIITEEPPPIRELDPSIPEDVVQILSKALAKAPEKRYQTGQELANDLLTLVRASGIPTIRQVEAPTARGLPAGPPPTIAGPGVAATIVTAPTEAGPARAATAPTVVKPQPAGPRPSAAAPARPQPSARPAPPPRRSSGALGLLVGLGVGGLVLAGLAGVAGWYFFLRKPPASESVPTTLPAVQTATSLPAASPVPSPESLPSASGVADTGARVDRPVTASTPPPAAGGGGAVESRPQAVPPSIQRPGPPGPGPRGGPGAPPPSQASPDYAYLDVPQEAAPDGTEAGRRLSESYRQGGSSSPNYGGGRFRPRERQPSQLLPAERPAVAALRHAMNAQEGFHKRNGRYGTYDDLVRAQLLFLDVPVQVRAFLRKSYRFELTVESDGYRISAIPTVPGLRPFVGDDSGYIRVDQE
jgi:serine/threonine protein kinase